MDIEKTKEELRLKIEQRTNFDTIGEEICQKFNIIYDKDGEFKIWNKEEFKYIYLDKIDLLNTIKEAYEISNLSNPSINTALLSSMMMGGRKFIPKPLEKFEVQFKDKIVDIMTGEEKEASPEYCCFNPIPHKLGTCEETPITDQIQFEAVKDWNKVKKIQEHTAIAFIQDNDLHKMLICYGGGGDGKSTYMEWDERVLGKENVVSGDFDSIYINRFGLALLYGKRRLYMSETNIGSISKTAVFKAQTGNDSVMIERKNKNAFSDRIGCKPIMSSNNPPIMVDKTDATYRRLDLCHFNGNFYSSTRNVNVLDKIPEEEYENFCRKAINLIKGVYERKGFTGEGSIEEIRDEYERISNPLEIFIKENMTEDPEGYILKADLKREFNAWSKQKRFRVYSSRELGKIMSNDYESGFKPIVVGDWSKGNTRAWLGLKWKGTKTKEELMKAELEQIKTEMIR